MAEIKLNLRTPEQDFSKEERAKLASNGMRGDLARDLRDFSGDNVVWETKQIAKSHGIYLEWNRAKTGGEKDWMYMVRLSIPGGGPIDREQWAVLDDLSEKYARDPGGRPSIRLTTRQSVQLHWVKKPDLAKIVKAMAEAGFATLNGCGDNVRNVMRCPLAAWTGHADAHALAREAADYFRLPAEPHIEIFEIDTAWLRTPGERFDYGPGLLNRKFKIAFAEVRPNEKTGRLEPDNCVELRTNDLGVTPVVMNEEVVGYQVYAGGGQGEKNGKKTFACLGEPFGVFQRKDLIAGLGAIAATHRDWGDRLNRHWARLKYVVRAKGVEWLQREARARGAQFEPPISNLDIGPRQLHHGWTRGPDRGRWAFGAFIECGRITDGPNGNLKSAVRRVMDELPVRAAITPNQDLIFTDVPDAAVRALDAKLAESAYGKRAGAPYTQLRLHAVACVGLDTCRLAYADSEKFLPELLDELERAGWGDLKESVGISGCERQCSRPATKAVGWVGAGNDRYLLKVMGSEDGSTQGLPLTGGEGERYLHSTPRERVAGVTGALFENYMAEKKDGEALGAYHKRIGMDGVIRRLKEHRAAADLMKPGGGKKTGGAPHKNAVETTASVGEKGASANWAAANAAR